MKRIGVPLQHRHRHTVRGGYLSQIYSIGTFLLGFVRLALIGSLVILGTHTWATSDVLFARARNSFGDLKDNFVNNQELPMGAAFANATLLACRMLAMVILCIECTVRVKRPFGEEIGPGFSLLRITRLPYLLTCAILLFIASSADTQAEFDDNNSIEREIGHTFDLIVRKARSELGIYDVFLLARVIVIGLGVIAMILSLKKSFRPPHGDFIRTNKEYKCLKCDKRAYFAKHTFDKPVYCTNHRVAKTIETTPIYSWLTKRYYEKNNSVEKNKKSNLRYLRLMFIATGGLYASYMNIYAMGNTVAPPVVGEGALIDLGWHPADVYVSTFHSIGCCRTDLETDHWQGQTDQEVLSNMYTICQMAERHVSDGTVRDVVEHQMCGCGNEAPICRNQSTYTSTRSSGGYGYTFKATGCCSTEPEQAYFDWWKTQLNSVVFNDMFNECESTRLGSANENQIKNCGCGSSRPSECILQTKFTPVWSVFIGHLGGAVMSLIVFYLVIYRMLTGDRLHTFELCVIVYSMLSARYLHAVDSNAVLRLFPFLWFFFVTLVYLMENIINGNIIYEITSNIRDLVLWTIVLLPHPSLITALVIGTGGVLFLAFAIQVETSVVIYGGTGFVLFGLLVGSWLDKINHPPIPEMFRKDLIAAQSRNTNLFRRVIDLKLWQMIYPLSLLSLIIGPSLIYTSYDAKLISATLSFNTSDIDVFIRQVYRLVRTAGYIINAFVGLARILNPCIEDILVASNDLKTGVAVDDGSTNGEVWADLYLIQQEPSDLNEWTGMNMGGCLTDDKQEAMIPDTIRGEWYNRKIDQTNDRQFEDYLWIPEEKESVLENCQKKHLFAHYNVNQNSAVQSTGNELLFLGNRGMTNKQSCKMHGRTWNLEFTDPDINDNLTVTARCSGVIVLKDTDSEAKEERTTDRCHTLGPDPPTCVEDKDCIIAYQHSGSKCKLNNNNKKTCTYPILIFDPENYGKDSKYFNKNEGDDTNTIAEGCPADTDIDVCSSNGRAASIRDNTENENNDVDMFESCIELQHKMNELTRTNLIRARANLEKLKNIRDTSTTAGNDEDVPTGITDKDLAEDALIIPANEPNPDSLIVSIPTYNKECLNTACVATAATIVGTVVAGVIAKLVCSLADWAGYAVVFGPFDFPGAICGFLSDIAPQLVKLGAQAAKAIYKYGMKLINGVKTMIKKQKTIRNAYKAMSKVRDLGGTGGKAIKLTSTALTGLSPFFGIGITSILLAVWSRETLPTNRVSILFAAVNFAISVACVAMLFTLFGFGGLFGDLGGITDQGFLVFMVNYILKPFNQGRFSASVYVTDEAEPLKWGLRITAIGALVMAFYCGLDFISRLSNEVELAEDGTTVSLYDGGIRRPKQSSSGRFIGSHPLIHRRRIGNGYAKIGASQVAKIDDEENPPVAENSSAEAKKETTIQNNETDDDNVMLGYEIGTTLGGWLIACLLAARPVFLGHRALVDNEPLFDINMRVTPETSSALLGITGGDVMRGGSALSSMDFDDVNCDFSPVGKFFKQILLKMVNIEIPIPDIPDIAGFDQMKKFWTDIFDDFVSLGAIFGELVENIKKNIGDLLENFIIDLNVPNIPIPLPIKYFWYVDWLLVWGIPATIVFLIALGTILSLFMPTTRKIGPGAIGEGRRTTLAMIRQSLVPLSSVALMQAFFLVALAGSFSTDFDAVIFTFSSGAGQSVKSAIESCFWLIAAAFSLHVNAYYPVNG